MKTLFYLTYISAKFYFYRNHAKLLQDVAQLKRTIEEAPLRMDAFVQYKEQLERFLAEKKQISYEESKDPIIVRLFLYQHIFMLYT